ncbi:MAG: hypothetical protein JWP52_4612 [Rhizobacter sp.]|nr:hypothetical protein [Rhizobacter sp.]
MSRPDTVPGTRLGFRGIDTGTVGGMVGCNGGARSAYAGGPASGKPRRRMEGGRTAPPSSPEGRGERRAGRGDPQVAGHRPGETGTGARPVHRGERALRHLVEQRGRLAGGDVRELHRPLRPGLAEIGARQKVPPGPVSTTTDSVSSSRSAVSTACIPVTIAVVTVLRQSGRSKRTVTSGPSIWRGSSIARPSPSTVTADGPNSHGEKSTTGTPSTVGHVSAQTRGSTGRRPALGQGCGSGTKGGIPSGTDGTDSTSPP